MKSGAVPRRRTRGTDNAATFTGAWNSLDWLYRSVRTALEFD